MVSIEVKDCAIKFLEHVQIRVNLNFSRRGDLSLQLRAPTDTTSPMTGKRHIDNLKGFRNLTDWIITSCFHWGEDPNGKWELKIDDFDKRYPSSGDLSWLTLKVLSYCVFVDGFIFVSYFSQSSEMPDQTSSGSCTPNTLFNLLPGNLGRRKLRTFKLSVSFLTFLAFSYAILIKQIFHMLTDSAIQLLRGYRFPNCGSVNVFRSFGILSCLFHRSTSQLVLDIVWHFCRPA